ncbi:hypothetical protein QUF88_07250 [Bacillus sp. DX1.1]|uniref:hypothetical protein n=1 Tax=unclassified Bacillus (in: firmicutes) TaxID=185979 RepID=UPI00256FDB04|nr:MULTISPECIES: hypothetical protein [unclassified Bacillus (in: firmicutes)]MDM5153632.1 hypothetical protein [Bacillus sp. DX1.1]WJE82578.1 hypothetical protein QRE67_04765 [Bacillus sp. DX3.1]
MSKSNEFQGAKQEKTKRGCMENGAVKSCKMCKICGRNKAGLGYTTVKIEK